MKRQAGAHLLPFYRPHISTNFSVSGEVIAKKVSLDYNLEKSRLILIYNL